jgi:ABC-type transport system substrate-binding protein
MRFRLAVKHPALSFGFLAFCFLTAACSGGREEELRVAMIGGSEAPFESGARLSTAGQLVRAATTEGLVGFDEQGRVIPALADRWIVTDDGLSYIFRLRDGTWPDGVLLTAESARSALRSAIASLKGTTLAQDVADIDEVRVMAGRVIEIRLSAANPDLLQLLAQPELGLLRIGGSKSSRRPLGAGPMSLARTGNVAVLTPISPRSRGLPDVQRWNERARPIRLSGTSAGRAVERFRTGDLDLVLGGTFADFPLTAGLGFLRGSVTPDPVIGLFGLAVVHGEGFLAAPENREAVAMAIDRDALSAAMGVSGWAVSSRVVSAGMAGDSGTIGERWANLTLPERQAEAAARASRWRKGNAGGVPRLRIALPAGKGADILFARLSQDLGAAGIATQRVTADADADLRLIDSVARYPRANWFLAQLSCAAKRGLCSEAADSLAEKARSAPDQASRSALFARAEAELTASNVYIPIGMPLRWSLVRSQAPGFAPNRFAMHPLMSLALLPR